MTFGDETNADIPLTTAILSKMDGPGYSIFQKYTVQGNYTVLIIFQSDSSDSWLVNTIAEAIGLKVQFTNLNLLVNQYGLKVALYTKLL